MASPSRVPGLSRVEACRVLQLSEALTNGAIFLLMATMHFRDKGRSTRILHSANLRTRKSIVEPLRVAGFDLDAVLRTLDDLGYIQTSWGMRTLRCTERGDAVKHGFNTVRLFLRVNLAYPQLGVETVADIDKLRAAMRAVCEGNPPCTHSAVASIGFTGPRVALIRPCCPGHRQGCLPRSRRLNARSKLRMWPSSRGLLKVPNSPQEA